MSFSLWLQLLEAQQYFDFMKVNKISPSEARQKKMFGPVWHGSSKEGREAIAQQGFNIFIGGARTGNVTHGYELRDYFGGIPAPVHHLGYGIYFTTSKTNAKHFNRETTRGLIDYYLDVPRLETINWGSPKTMMKWWKENGYDMKPSGWQMGQTGTWNNMKVMGSVPQDNPEEMEKARIQATINMTNVLKSKYDAVWYKGKGFGKLLDGDQIVVYDLNNIYQLDWSMEQQKEGGVPPTGSRFVVKGTKKAIGVVSGSRENQQSPEYDEWAKVLGRSTHNLWLSSFKDPDDEIYKVYAPMFQKTISPELKQRIMDNQQVDEQEAINYFLNNRLRKYIKQNFPLNLVGKVLKKGERLK